MKRIFDISFISFLYIQFDIKPPRLLLQLLLQTKPFSTAFHYYSELFLHPACVFFQRFHIHLSIPAQCHIFPHDRSDPHIFIHQKRLPDDILTVQFFTDHAGAYRIPVQTDRQIEKRCPVSDFDVLIPVQCA